MRKVKRSIICLSLLLAGASAGNIYAQQQVPSTDVMGNAAVSVDYVTSVSNPEAMGSVSSSISIDYTSPVVEDNVSSLTMGTVNSPDVFKAASTESRIGVYKATSTDTRTGVYKAKYTANGKTTTEWCYLKNGKVQYKYTGFASNSSGWWYVEKGRVTFKKTDVIKGKVKNQDGWWFVKGSQVQFVDSVEKNSNGWWRIKNGKVDFGFTGIARNANGWWYCKGGKVQFIDSVEKNENGWWAIRNGKVDFNYTGFAKNSSGWWYCIKGKVDFSKKDIIKGTVNGQSGYWYVSGGKVQFVDSVEKNSSGWWSVQNGKVNFNFTGMAKNSNGWWYCKGGKVQMGFEGFIKLKCGATVSFKNGKFSADNRQGNIVNLMKTEKYLFSKDSITSKDGKLTVCTEGMKKIYIYSYDNDLKTAIQNTINDNQELYKLVEFVDLKTDSNGKEYRSAIDKALKNSDKYPSLFAADMSSARYWSEDSTKTAALASIGITGNMYSNAYDYTKDFGTYNGELRAVTWQATPGAFVYRRDIAKKVFGVSEPEDVQKLVKDWDSFFAAAEKLKKAGYPIVLGPDDIKYAVLAGKKNQWITSLSDGSAKLTLDQSVTDYLEYSKKLYNGYYTNNKKLWSIGWDDSIKKDDVFGCFVTTDTFNKVYSSKAFGQWGVCKGPSPYVCGGDYVMVGKNTSNPELCEFIIYELCCDQEYMYDLTCSSYGFTNNKAANARLVKEGVDLVPSWGEYNVTAFLGGQNPLGLFADIAGSIKKVNVGTRDMDILPYIDYASECYNNGYASTRKDALNMIKMDAKKGLGLKTD